MERDLDDGEILHRLLRYPRLLRPGGLFLDTFSLWNPWHSFVHRGRIGAIRCAIAAAIATDEKEHSSQSVYIAEERAVSTAATCTDAAGETAFDIARSTADSWLARHGQAEPSLCHFSLGVATLPVLGFLPPSSALVVPRPRLVDAIPEGYRVSLAGKRAFAWSSDEPGRWRVYSWGHAGPKGTSLGMRTVPGSVVVTPQPIGRLLPGTVTLVVARDHGGSAFVNDLGQLYIVGEDDQADGAGNDGGGGQRGSNGADGDRGPRRVYRPPGLENAHIVGVALGNGYEIAWDASGDFYVRGDNSCGQLGIFETVDKNDRSFRVGPSIGKGLGGSGNTVGGVATGAGFTLFLVGGNVLVTLPDGGLKRVSLTGGKKDSGGLKFHRPLASVVRPVAVAAAGRVAAVLDGSGRVLTWIPDGRDPGDAPLGRTQGSPFTPLPVAGSLASQSVTSLSASPSLFVAVSTVGHCHMWGRGYGVPNGHGVVLDEGIVSIAEPRRLSVVGGVSSASCGDGGVFLSMLVRRPKFDIGSLSTDCDSSNSDFDDLAAYFGSGTGDALESIDKQAVDEDDNNDNNNEEEETGVKRATVPTLQKLAIMATCRDLQPTHALPVLELAETMRITPLARYIRRFIAVNLTMFFPRVMSPRTDPGIDLVALEKQVREMWQPRDDHVPGGPGHIPSEGLLDRARAELREINETRGRLVLPSSSAYDKAVPTRTMSSSSSSSSVSSSSSSSSKTKTTSSRRRSGKPVADDNSRRELKIPPQEVPTVAVSQSALFEMRRARKERRVIHADVRSDDEERNSHHDDDGGGGDTGGNAIGRRGKWGTVDGDDDEEPDHANDRSPGARTVGIGALIYASRRRKGSQKAGYSPPAAWSTTTSNNCEGNTKNEQLNDAGNQTTPRKSLSEIQREEKEASVRRPRALAANNNGDSPTAWYGAIAIAMDRRPSSGGSQRSLLEIQAEEQRRKEEERIAAEEEAMLALALEMSLHDTSPYDLPQQRQSRPRKISSQGTGRGGKRNGNTNSPKGKGKGKGKGKERERKTPRDQ